MTYADKLILRRNALDKFARLLDQELGLPTRPDRRRNDRDGYGAHDNTDNPKVGLLLELAARANKETTL